MPFLLLLSSSGDDADLLLLRCTNVRPRRLLGKLQNDTIATATGFPWPCEESTFNLVRGKIARPRRLLMEFLEQRLLMAQDVWTGAGDGKSWQDGSNWSLNAAPGASDSALITRRE